MKETWKIVSGITVLLALTACSPTTDKSARTGTGTSQSIEQTREVVEKLPDADAPELELISIYYPKKDETGLRQVIDGVETVDAESLVVVLIDYGVLDEGTEVLDFVTEGGSQELIAGPGNSTTVERFSSGILNLSQIPPGADQLLTETAIANTFTESMNIQELTIQVSGGVYAAGLTFNEHYGKLK